MHGDDQEFLVHCMFEYVQAEADKFVALHANDTPKRAPALVQVGAHLAWLNPNDPFSRRFSSKGTAFKTVLVEPQPRIYERLVKAAEGVNSVEVVNNAVCNTTGKVTFYAVDVGDVAHLRLHGSQVASLSRNHILKHKRWVPDIEERIIEIDVACETVENIVKGQGLLTEEHSDVFILSVDAEGFDADILLSVDWTVIRPRLVVYEYIHLFSTKEGRVKAGDLQFTLNSHGYTCFKEKENIWCVGGEDMQTSAEHTSWSPCDTSAAKAGLSSEQLKNRFMGEQFRLCGYGYKSPDVAPRIPSERQCTHTRHTRRRLRQRAGGAGGALGEERQQPDDRRSGQRRQQNASAAATGSWR
mmetsp:Transcript_15682/g.32716  ORF Transcript_15682/g.32716 Transcript_15682/m.32716 type:complete len:356 (-) Transcript_15682:68-1135(-)